MKNRRFKISSDENIDVNILPLIDVLFAVLLFFMLSSLVLTQKYSLEINRPSLQNPSKLAKKPRTVTISIDKEKRIFINSQKVELQSLGNELILQQKTKPIDQVLIDADHAINYGFMIKVLSSIKGKDIQSVSLAVNKEKDI